MTTLPKWLTEFVDDNIELLSAKRGKIAWKVAFSCGAAILVLDVPYDALGRADMVIALQALASAIESDPPEQPALPNLDPKAKEKAASKPESTKTVDDLLKKTQQSLGLPEPVSPLGPSLPPAPPDTSLVPITKIEDYQARKPRGKKPKAENVVLDLEGDSIELPGDMLVSRYIGPDAPPEDTDILGVNDLTLKGWLKPAHAASIVQGGWCLWWSPESKCFIRLQGRHPAGRTPK